MSGDRSSQVRVGVRVRPLAAKEIQQGGNVSLSVFPPSSITIASNRTFTYDAVFDSQTNQDELYNTVSSSLLDSFVDGYNATILAYGQTGSGKTYTMGSEAYAQPEGSPQLGLIPRFISDFFQKMEAKKQASEKDPNSYGGNSRESHASGEPSPLVRLDYKMKASFLEVYGEDVYDLLDSQRKSLPLREDSAGGVVVAGLTDKNISSPNEALDVLHEGANNRTTAATLMNLTSSRSHAVFTIHLTQTTLSQEQINVVATSKFTFVDLAGSERMKKTGAEGERAREGIKINEGLLALGNVINALADEDRLAKEKSIHVPYRQSKLTRLLQDALGGNSQTFFLACVSPSDSNVSETLSTLRYAHRARNIRNAPTKNLDATTSELQRLSMLTQVLQTELIKARFQDGNDKPTGEQTVTGVVDECLSKRTDVLAYLDLIYRTAHDLSGVNMPPSFDLRLTTPDSHPSRSSAVFPICSSVLNGPLATTEKTPKKSSLERIDESFHIDVNPDEDIAILDRLLELQHHEHEFERATKQGNEEIRTMDGELRKEQTLLLQLRENLKAYHSLKQKYEELLNEVQQLEAEKDGLAKQLEKASADPTIGNSVAIKKQLEKVELSLTRARRETLTHRQKYKAAEDQARRCQVLERKISTLKQAKSSLLKKQKETTARYKEVTDAKTKELLALKRKEKAADVRLSEMKTEIQRHKTILEKRKQYCTRLSDKLKQTETHLMKLLSMRRRDFAESTNIEATVGLSTLNVSTHAEDTMRSPSHDSEHLSNEDLKSIEFISNKMISERIEAAVSSAQYRQLVATYSETMRLVIDSVKLLQGRAASMEVGDGGPHQSKDEIKETVAELELKLELLGADIREMESRLPDDNKEARDEEVVTKLMSQLPAMAFRKMLRDCFSRIVEVESQKHAMHDLLLRKDAALSSLENELEIIQGKVEFQSRELVNRRILTESGSDVFELLRQSEEKCKGMDAALARVQVDLSRSFERVSETEAMLVTKKNELENTKDSLVLVTTALADVNGSIKSEETLRKLQAVWAELGVDETYREQVRSALMNCISDTCDRHFVEAALLKSTTQKEIGMLEAKRNSMVVALSLPSCQGKKLPGLLMEVKSLRDEVSKLEVVFIAANSRRERILLETISLSSALGIKSSDLPANLQHLIQHIEEPKPSTKSIGRLRRASIMENVQAMVDSISNHIVDTLETVSSPVLSHEYGMTCSQEINLEEGFLRRCEEDVAELRVRKSEMLVENREKVQKIRELSKSLHATAPELVRLVENTLQGGESSLPVWWESDYVVELLKMVVVSSPLADSGDVDSRCIQLILETLELVAGRRHRISSLLRAIVENAQQALLDIVSRELNASEACASFRDALQKLPSLSIDFCQSCITEMEALVVGVEAMTQSEIEALTVVWEALKVSMEERREFWGRIDEENGGSKSIKQDSDHLDELKRTLQKTKNAEDWIVSLVSRGISVQKELEGKLNKLSAIHKQVEKLRLKQDTKSQVMSLDSEIRILNSKLQDFEEFQCSKQRLLTKKTGSTALLKEARFRKQMTSNFVTKLEVLASLLRSWEAEEGQSFDASLLSEDVRMLLNNPDRMESWIEKRTKLMPSRTVPANISPRKRSFDDQEGAMIDSNPFRNRQSGELPQRKKVVAAARQTRLHAPSSVDMSARSPMRKRKTAPREPSDRSLDEEIHNPSPTRLTKRFLTGRKDSKTLPPFGRILSELSSPNQKDSK